jgi:hypothetical protein
MLGMGLVSIIWVNTGAALRRMVFEDYNKYINQPEEGMHEYDGQ